MIKKFILLTFIVLSTIGCVATNFAKTTSTASIEEEFYRKELLTWGSTRIHSVDNISPANGDNGVTFTFDAGQKKIGIYYYARTSDMPSGMALRSEVTYFNVDLKTNTKYRLASEYADKLVILKMIDSGNNNNIIAQSNKIPVSLLPLLRKTPYSKIAEK